MPDFRDNRYIGAVLAVAVMCVIAVIILFFFWYPDLTGGGPPGKLSLTGDDIDYSPSLSSVPGIQLRPDYSGDYFSLRYHWKTNYGYFLDWDPLEYIVIPMGSEVVTDSRTLYWTYNPSDVGKEKPPVTVTVTLEDSQSGKVLDEASLDIIWLDPDTARVKNRDQMIKAE
jgi:hypothetical protein